MRLLSLDLAKLTGWSVGSPDGVEGFGTHEFPSVPAWALGEYGMAARMTFRRMLGHIEPDGVVYEAPILRPGTAKINGKGRAYLEVRDTPAKLRKMYGLGWELEIECHRAGVPCEEADMGRVRHHFLMGKVPRKSDECKTAVKVMSRRRGWDVLDDNEADSLATLDYQLAIKHPQWAANSTVLRIGAGVLARLSSSGPAVFSGSRVFFPPATRKAEAEISPSSSAGPASVSSTAIKPPGKTMATIRPSTAAMSSTSSASQPRRAWQR